MHAWVVVHQPKRCGANTELTEKRAFIIPYRTRVPDKQKS